MKHPVAVEDRAVGGRGNDPLPLQQYVSKLVGRTKWALVQRERARHNVRSIISVLSRSVRDPSCISLDPGVLGELYDSSYANRRPTVHYGIPRGRVATFQSADILCD